MTVKIRLKRMGKKKAPSYRVVVADSRFSRDGRIIENIMEQFTQAKAAATTVHTPTQTQA
ncbi:MAG: hypothetical protein NVS9B9_26670 [Ktedonobacteraceae bacterium]